MGGFPIRVQELSPSRSIGAEPQEAAIRHVQNQPGLLVPISFQECAKKNKTMF